MKKIQSFIIGFITINLLWLAASALLSNRALPGPITVYSHFDQILAAGIGIHILASLYRIFSGLFLAAIIGIPTGLAMARSPLINKVLHPLVYFSYPVPKTALLPAAMLLLGLGDGSKLVIILLTTVFQIIISVRDAVLNTDPSCYQVAVSAGASRRTILKHITLPAILPELFTCLRIGTGTSLAVLFLVEAYGTRKGIGYFILDAWSRINYIQMYGGIVVISIAGALLFFLLDMAADRICRWTRTTLI